MSYFLDNEAIDKLPALIENLARFKPVYEIFPGWQSSTKEVDKIRGHPENAHAFDQSGIKRLKLTRSGCDVSTA